MELASDCAGRGKALWKVSGNRMRSARRLSIFFFASGLLYIRWRGCCSERQGGFVPAEKQKEPFPGLPERFFPFLVLPAGAPDNPPVLPEEVPPLFQEVPVLQVHFRSRVHSPHRRRPEAPRHLRQNTLHCPLQRRPEVPERDLPRF